MKRTRLTGIFAAGLLWSLSMTAMGQDKTADPPPAGEETNEPKLSPEELKRQEEFAMAQMQEQLRRGINPAYHPLIPTAGMFDFMSGIDPSGKDFPKPIYTCPLRELARFLEQQKIQENLTLTRQWLANFHGLLPETPVPASQESEVGFANMMGTEMLFFGTTPSFYALTAEARLGLANSNAEQALSNFEERLKIEEAFALDSAGNWILSIFMTDSQAPFLAQSLDKMTPRQCSRLIGLVERWSTGNDAWRNGMERSLAQDLKNIAKSIPNSGELPDYEAMAATAATRRTSTAGSSEGAEAGDDSGAAVAESAPDTPIDQAIQQVAEYDGPPTQLALERRQIAQNAIREDYSRIAQMFQNPFAPQPKRVERPKWLRQISMSSMMMMFDDQSTESRSDMATNEMKRTALRRLMLATHAAIRKFRWEHDRLPVTLAELEKPRLTTNPMTKKPFDYVINGSKYALTCDDFKAEPGSGFGGVRGRTMDLLTEEISDMMDMGSGSTTEAVVSPIPAQDSNE